MKFLVTWKAMLSCATVGQRYLAAPVRRTVFRTLVWTVHARVRVCILYNSTLSTEYTWQLEMRTQTWSPSCPVFFTRFDLQCAALGEPLRKQSEVDLSNVRIPVLRFRNHSGNAPEIRSCLRGPGNSELWVALCPAVSCNVKISAACNFTRARV